MAESKLKRDLYAKIVTYNSASISVTEGTPFTIGQTSNIIQSGQTFVGVFKLFSSVGGYGDTTGQVSCSSDLSLLLYTPTKSGQGVTIKYCVFYQ